MSTEQTGVIVEDDENENHNENDSQEELVITETKPEPEEDGEGDEKVAQNGGDDGEDDAERAAIRERRRKEKLERKERKEKAITRDKLELDFLRKRNDDLERRVSAQEVRSHQSDLSTLDSYINAAAREVEMAENVIAKAVAAGNGEDVAKAMRFRDQAMAKVQQLSYEKQNAATRPVQAAPAIDDVALHYAKEFMEENKWYDPKGRDEASSIVLTIDKILAAEGHDPSSEDYWDELRDRVAKRLPEKFKQSSAPASTSRAPRGGPAVGSGREHAPTSTRKEVYISPERKQALIDAGVWDDPVLRMKYVKRYAAYDRDKR